MSVFSFDSMVCQLIKITIDFPNDIIEPSVSDIKSINEKELLKVDIKSELNALGLDQHLDTSFTVGDTYYAHNAEVLASGFLTNESQPISVYEKLIELQSEIIQTFSFLNDCAIFVRCSQMGSFSRN